MDALPISELSHRFLVALLRQTCSLMNEYNRHGYLLSRSERGKTTMVSRRDATQPRSVPNVKPSPFGAPAGAASVARIRSGSYWPVPRLCSLGATIRAGLGSE
jgi:hypothetical protein